MRIHTAAELREIDRRAADELGLPTALLMENAGREIAVAVRRRVSRGGIAWLVCGKGNNGGDGWCAARQLLVWGVDARVWSLVDVNELKDDALLNARAALACGVPLVTRLEAGEGDVVVDALFGTGLTRALRDDVLPYVHAIAEARRRGAFVVSVDIPSGLDADRPHAPGEHVVADLTVTLHALKPALVQHPARAACGEIWLGSIGLPTTEPVRRRWLEASHVSGLLPRRPIDAHKGTAGHLLVVAGSPGKSGAAMLSCRAALRAGAGLVTLAAPASVIDRVLPHMPEVMAHVLPQIERDALTAALERCSALAIGPGIERDDDTADEIVAVLATLDMPALLDADALNAIAQAPTAQLSLQRAKRTPVLTPHPTELARLLGTSTQDVQSDRLAAAVEAARRFSAHVVLKGACTVVAHPDGMLEVLPFENPALATAGSGDVLTGLGGALLAQRIDPRAVSQLGPWLHGRAGELAADGRTRGLIASDLIDHIPAALTELS